MRALPSGKLFRSVVWPCAPVQIWNSDRPPTDSRSPAADRLRALSFAYASLRLRNVQRYLPAASAHGAELTTMGNGRRQAVTAA